MDLQSPLGWLSRTSGMLPLLGRILDQAELVGVSKIGACANPSFTAAAGGYGDVQHCRTPKSAAVGVIVLRRGAV